MAAPSVGTVSYRFFQTGKETTHGTSVAATRRWIADNPGWNLDRHHHVLGGSRSRATRRRGSVQTGVTLEIPYRGADGASYNELIFPLSQLDAAQSGVAGTSDYVWTFAINQTAPEDYETYTIEWGDETQEYEAENCFATGFRLSGDASSPDSMTEMEIDWVGRQSTKSTKTASLTNTDVRIPAYLWLWRFATAQSGLSGASDVLNFVRSWTLDVKTGLVAHFYSDGLNYFGQVVRSEDVDATLTLTVDSNAQAVSQFYDKAATNTVDFIQGKATGPALGASTYVAQFQVAVEYDEPTVIGGDIDGVNTYEVVAHLVDDVTWGQSMSWSVTNALATLLL